MRTFQFSDAKSHKFWNIDVQGNSFTVTYGKIGAAGQTQTKTFGDAAAAQAEADKLIKEKTKKGYVETTASASASEAEAFEKSLTENADDFAGWCAYADYLVEQGDPRGEFMQVQLALEDESKPKKERDTLKKKEAALLKKHERDWLGGIAQFLLDPKPKKQQTREIGYRFRRGWLHELNVLRLGVEFTRALLKCPEARMLGRVHFHTSAYEYPADASNIPEWVDGTYAPGPDLPANVDRNDAAFYLLSRFPYFAAVRSLHLGNDVNADGADSDHCHTDGEMAYHYLKQMPHVEEIRLLAHRVDTAKLFALPMPRLRVLQVFHASSYPLDKLAANKSLTNLTDLLLQPHAPDDEQPYIRPREMKAICRSPNLPNLTHLMMRYTTVGDEGVRELVSAGLLKRLKVLDLHGGCVTDAGAKVLADSPDVKNLARLNLDMNALSPAGMQLLKKSGVSFSAQNQHGHVPPFEDELPEFLFYADIE